MTSPTRRPSGAFVIVMVALGVTAMALIVTVLVLRSVMLRDLDDRIDEALELEGAELTEFVAREPIGDDETAEAFARRMLTRFLESNVTDIDVTLVASQRGTAFLQSADPRGDLTELAADTPALVTPRFRTIDTDAGRARVLDHPIVDDGRQAGVLSAVWFVERAVGQVNRTVRQAAIVAAAAFTIALGLAWIAARRLVAPIGLLAQTARDITERDLGQRLPEQGSDEIASLISSFNAMLDRLQSALDTQRTFLDDVGHELRTPLTIMQGNLDLLDDGVDGIGASRDLLLGEVERMSRLVDDLLVLAQAGEFEFIIREPIDCDDLLHEIHRLVPALGDHDWQLEQAPPGVVDADRPRLIQAMLNLAANAARHTPAGQTITIGAELDDDFTLYVRDTGEGIDAADHEQIFDRYRQSRSDLSGRAGLGLAIVQAITEAHGGSVSVASRVGHGATFTITIPTTQPGAE